MGGSISKTILMIKITDKKIIKLIREKDGFVKQGRNVSIEITEIEKEIAELDKQEREYTEKANPQELIDKGNALRDEINKKIEELEKIGKEIQDYKIAAIPEEMKKKHYELRGKKEKKERERNRFALKIQKVKDRLIPLVQKICLPQIGEYEDIESVELKDDVAEVKVINLVEQYKTLIKEKKHGKKAE